MDSADQVYTQKKKKNQGGGVLRSPTKSIYLKKTRDTNTHHTSLESRFIRLPFAAKSWNQFDSE